MGIPLIPSQLESFTWTQARLLEVSSMLKCEFQSSIVAVKPLNENDTELKNVLLKSNAAGKYRGWTNKENKDPTERYFSSVSKH